MFNKKKEVQWSYIQSMFMSNSVRKQSKVYTARRTGKRDNAYADRDKNNYGVMNCSWFIKYLKKKDK